MKKINIEFEHFITKRFLEFYNARESTEFEIKEKADEKEREKPIYDFYCFDKNSKREMAIEVKRLITKRKTHVQNIINWVHKYVEKPLIGKIEGNYSILIKGFKSPFKLKRKERKKLLIELKEEIQALKDPGEYTKLKCVEGLSLLRWSKEGSAITAWPVDFSSADDEEIVRILDASLKKFERDEMINIVLLVELSISARRTEIANIIKQLEHGFEPKKFDADPRNFDLINGIYHIGIHRGTVIAQVYPSNKIFESGFFNPSDFMEITKFKQWTIEHLL